jgi:hypothetical protein
MKVNCVNRSEFFELVLHHREDLLSRIAVPQAFIVQKFFDGASILQWREMFFERGMTSEPSWHPLYDGCPDYHRLHDDYPNAYVKSKMHGFYNHGWYQDNIRLFEFFKDVFILKNIVGDFSRDAFITNVPSDGHVGRVNFQHYPRGGGYMAEHIDPVGKHAHLQTLIQASQLGKDYKTGGVFAREKPGSPKFYLDEYATPGDLIVMSPGIPHGVDPIDPEMPYNWRQNDGRWVVIPIVVSSDYSSTAVKPQEVSQGVQAVDGA